jgi:hypothetical protein
MQGADNDRKAEDLCARLNAAWKELGPTILALREREAKARADRDHEWAKALGWNPGALGEDCTPEGMAAILREGALATAESQANEVENARAEALEQAAQCAKDRRNISMAGGSTGDAFGTALMIEKAIRALD